MNPLRTLIPGLAVAALLAALAVFIADEVAAGIAGLPKIPLSPVMCAVVLGMLWRNTLGMPVWAQPGLNWTMTGPNARQVEIFISLYFALTGLHALHMVIGFVLLSVITWMAHKGRFSPEWYTPVEMSGLYWHFVDIVWIFLFPLLYLVDRTTAHVG